METVPKLSTKGLTTSNVSTLKLEQSRVVIAKKKL